MLSLPIISCPCLTYIRTATSIALAAVLITPLSRAQSAVSSPGLQVNARIFTSGNGTLMYEVNSKDHQLIEPSPFGVRYDGMDLGVSVVLGVAKRSAVHEQYAAMGAKAVSLSDSNIITIPAKSHGVSFTIEARAFDDGFAWRIIIPGNGPHHIEGEDSSWTLPSHSKIWFGERNNSWKLKSYAGEWRSTDIESLPHISSEGPVQATPLVVELPTGGYLLLTEASLADYSGMRLRAVGERRVVADFTEGIKGFDVDGNVTTPWRVTFADHTLNDLVNSNILQNLNPPPDTNLFANQSYIHAGKSVWRFWSRQTGSPSQEREFIDYAARLEFQYSLVDDGWDDWPNRWDNMKFLCDYAKQKGVAIFAWKDAKYIDSLSDNWAQLRDFLDHAKAAGLAGVKIDFINGESKEKVDFERAVLTFAAQRQLMVDFHGIQKPTGEERTFPNAISREGIRGLELNRMSEGPIPPGHNAALPFTRLAVGSGDYTPLSYTWPGNTTWAHQLATVVAFTSPFLTIAEDPEVLLNDPATRPGLDVLKAIPSVWDQTVVLRDSAIGELAIIARRSGKTWFLAALNGKDTPVDLRNLALSFLGEDEYDAILITSPERRSLNRSSQTLRSKSRLDVHLGGGDGLVVWLRPKRADL